MNSATEAWETGGEVSEHHFCDASTMFNLLLPMLQSTNQPVSGL